MLLLSLLLFYLFFYSLSFDNYLHTLITSNSCNAIIAMNLNAWEDVMACGGCDDGVWWMWCWCVVDVMMVCGGCDDGVWWM